MNYKSLLLAILFWPIIIGYQELFGIQELVNTPAITQELAIATQNLNPKDLVTNQELRSPILSLRWTLSNLGTALQVLASATTLEQPEPILNSCLPDKSYFEHQGQTVERINGVNIFIKPYLISFIGFIKRLNGYFKEKLIDFNITTWLLNKSIFFASPSWQAKINGYQGFGSSILDRFDITNPYHWATAGIVTGTTLAASTYGVYKLCCFTHSFSTKSVASAFKATQTKQKEQKK